jgi:hypothetical protein
MSKAFRAVMPYISNLIATGHPPLGVMPPNSPIWLRNGLFRRGTQLTH